MHKIAIIGAGASGLMAAITAAKAGADVTVFEQNDAPGKKILASGNGRCNIINTDTTVAHFDGTDPAFAAHALEAMPFKRFEALCLSMGMLLATKEDGKCYPLSHEARTVKNVFSRAALQSGASIATQTRISEVKRDADGFTLITDGRSHHYDRVILCTGSPAAPQLGGTDLGLRIADNLGHTVIDPFPALVGLHLEHPALGKMAGVKTTAKVTLIENKTVLGETQNDILFTRYGLSGFAVLDLSYAASEALCNHAGVGVIVDLLPDFTAQQLATKIDTMAKASDRLSYHDLLTGLLPEKLIDLLLRDHHIASYTLCEALNMKTAKSMAIAIKQWKFKVTSTHGFKHAEVAGGGVSTAEVDPATMQSTLVPGLYLAGEVLDITGHRGGYNFHFAWGSGYLAGQHAVSS